MPAIERKSKHDCTMAGWREPPSSRHCVCISVGQCNETSFLPFERGSHTIRHLLQRWLPTYQENQELFTPHQTYLQIQQLHIFLSFVEAGKQQHKQLPVEESGFCSSTSHYLILHLQVSQGQSSAHIDRAQKSQLKTKITNIYVPYRSRVCVLVWSHH